ncbi:anhydro-N-acetylmuramic acid kinase [Methylobacterium haplocladii]|uniref:Anhydro-N-acetylmuramic acid kinase n=1 Tax=Methylobacterium haplocladii TaxID=1176176 RepID=A0A512IKQ8_9HYPH|nr:anhydro-N-acetylmuramic acid kinase [Methylobacterium haplocladii]GEO98281.1 anhydro-N-acetylmuramic acid kinase [Methylobacterium haplocladii]GJD84324.1 Anhydro-N-acetylmuramic acid kinase [Methylobacterium haplocladii]GLS58425.1 anhydro-N-acetylmuramic acid kinase [Methylobacterium haplocladii]
MTMKRAIGLMSGTSLDGVDVALIETDGERVQITKGRNNFLDPLGPTGYRGYEEEERTLLRRATRDAESVILPSDRPGHLPEAEVFVTRAHAEAVERFLADNGLSAADIEVIGFHGQTVIHRPQARISIQIGDGQALADRVGIPVVSDLRRADIDAGGQGAPLVPIFHKALAEAAGFEGAFGILNIGGVANATLIDSRGGVVAFDTGPGNALIDEWMQERENKNLDDGGRTAARGKPDDQLLAWLLQHPFFAKTPPKSLDRNWFSHKLAGQLSTEDGAATLTAFTARAVLLALDHAPERPTRWVIAGGGAKNGELMRLLTTLLDAEILMADAIGWSSAFLEAQAFAYLAMRTLKDLPITFPSTTGVSRPISGGVLSRPR